MKAVKATQVRSDEELVQASDSITDGILACEFSIIPDNLMYFLFLSGPSWCSHF